MDNDATPSTGGRGRGRARARGHRSPSPRPGMAPRGRSRSPTPLQQRELDQPVPPGIDSSGSGSGGTGYPEVSARMAQLSVTGETIASGSDDSGRKDTRASTRGQRAADTIFQDYNLRTRPKDLDSKKGSRGNLSRMITNYFRLKSGPTWTLHEYHMVTTPPVDKVSTRKYILRRNKDKLGAYLFDGTKLYTSTQLEPTPFEFDYTLDDGSKFTVLLKYHGKVAPGDPTYMHFYHVILRTCLFGMKLEEMGRNFYDHEAAIKIPTHRLELWPGYITSLRLHENDVLLCVETTHKVLRLDSVLTTIKQIQQNTRGGDITAAVHAQLRDTIVLTAYNRKTYRITDVDFNTTPLSTFETTAKDGTKRNISYVEYYETKHGQTITDLKQPMLVTTPKKKDLHGEKVKENQVINLVPELCQFTGLTDAMRENFNLMKELSKYLHVGPQERVKEIYHFMKRLTSTTELTKSLNLWGLTFDQKLSTVEGRCLPSERIVFAGGQEEIADNKGDWTKAFRSKKMLTTVNLNKWVIIVPQRDAGGVANLCNMMSKVSLPLDMKIAQPTEVFQLTDIKGPTYVKAINTLVDKYPDLQMLFVILPNKTPEPYGTVKKRLAVDFGIPSQCFVSRNVTSKGLMSIATKVVVQMNAKLGGEPWTIKIPLKNTMVVGYDVYHGAKGNKSGSIGAMVATLTPTFAKYFSTTSLFKNNEEFFEVILADFTKCLHAYTQQNGVLPEKIVFFRDGVGDGQLRQVHEMEKEALERAMKEVYAGTTQEIPKFALIVVTKKINSRIMLDYNGKYDNPPPGTVVDDVITLPERYDFFLVSCAARQGTVSPCSYNILHDTLGLDPDKLQMLTYKMCHMYFNWSGTVAVPAPCQYAHKLAYITGLSYGGAANQKLSRLLHFL